MMSIYIREIRNIIPLIGFALLSAVAASAQESAPEKPAAAKVSNIIAGRVIMRDRKLLTLREPEILAKAREYGKRVAASLEH